MKKTIVILAILAFLVPCVQSLQIFSEDYISIDEAVNDDVFVAGSDVNINAPVLSAVIAGGDININAPIKNDLFVAGGNVNINSDVGGKVVAAGGKINLKGNVGTNVVIAGGDVFIHSSSTIGKDALIAGGSVVNAGKVNGNLTVRSSDFKNKGVAGNLDYKKSEFPNKFFERAKGFLNIAYTLASIGLVIPGIVIMRLFPSLFLILDDEIRKSPLRNLAVGFILIIVSIVLIAVIAITVVGLTLSIILLMLFIIALMLSFLFVSFSVGKKLLSPLKIRNNILILIIGFLIVYILIRAPYAGTFVGIVAVSAGFGSIIYAIRENWIKLTGRS